jgi:N-acetylmuramoyl-L-alanine amidase
MTCPAVTVEITPEQNHETAAGLDDKDYQARVAAALAAALLEWRTDTGRTEARP